MSDIASLIADMVRAGVDPDLIGRTAEALADRDTVKIVDEQAERRREKDRERKRLRNSAESAEDNNLSSPLGSSPTPPSPNPHQSIPPSPPKGGSSPTDFINADFENRFWPEYPHKVGKADALKAFRKAAKRVDLETLMAGLARYVAKTDDRPWCNPSTWLNQDRWADQPASVARAQPPPQVRETEFARHQRECTEALERRVYGEKRNDELASNSPAFDLEPRDWRTH